MSLSFSERYGLKPVRDTFQVENMDEELKTGIWNSLLATCFDDNYNPHIHNPLFENFCKTIWINFFKNKLNEFPEYGNIFIEELEEYVFEGEWYEVYDLIEFLSANDRTNAEFRQELNKVLEREMSAYRLIVNEITPIISDIEIEEIELAINNDSLKHVSTHLESALNLLSDRKNPSYRNSIKESISAVEGVAKLITKNSGGELKNALTTIEDQLGKPLHGALKSGFLKIYGYTSDGDGIRHALTGAENISFEDAKFMLVACSAFVNYLIAKAKIDLKP